MYPGVLGLSVFNFILVFSLLTYVGINAGIMCSLHSPKNVALSSQLTDSRVVGGREV